MRAIPLAALVAALTVGFGRCAYIYTKSWPVSVSMAGGTLLYIDGYGFSEDQFNQFDPTLGNKVVLVNEVDTIPCDVITHLTSTSRIVCNTRPRTNMKAPEVYTIKAFVDGDEVEGYKVKYVASFGPSVRGVMPVWDVVGQMVQVTGWFFTNSYQLINTSDPLNSVTSSVILSKVYMGGQECEMHNTTTDELYGPFSRYSLVCKVLSTYAGPMNTSLYVTTRGNSINAIWSLYVDAQDRLYQYHTFPVVSSVSPRTSSSGGGALLTIKGVGFDAHPGATVVRVGGASCQVKEINNTRITCLAPPQSQTTPASGERGLLMETWEGLFFNDLTTEVAQNLLTPEHQNYSAVVQNSTNFRFNITKPSSVRISGHLQVAHDGDYSLYHTLYSRTSWLYIASDGNVDNKTLAQSRMHFSLQRDTPAYVEILYSGSDTNFVLQMEDYNAKFSASQSAAAKNERQFVQLFLGVRHEVQRLQVTGDVSSMSFYLNGFTSGPVTNVSDAIQVRSALMSLVEQQCQIEGDDIKFSEATGFEPGDQFSGHRGILKEDLEPYCGRFSSQFVNYNFMYYQSHYSKMVDPYTYGYMCFAIRGKVENKMEVLLYGPRIMETKRSVNSISYYTRRTFIQHNFTSTEKSWSYQCLKLLDQQDGDDSYLYNPTPMRVKAVYPPRPVDKNAPIYFDEVAFVDQSITVTQGRPSALKSHGILVSNVTVTPVQRANNNTLVYDIAFPTVNCVGDFPLLGVVTEDMNLGWKSELASANNYTFTLDGGNVIVGRQREASHVVSGSWALDIENIAIKGISPLASRREVQDLIAGGLGVKGVEVTGQGNCYGFSWYIEWTEHPGRKTLAKVNDEDLVFDGDSLSLGIRRVAEGKILHSPLSLDFLTVRRTEPYVAVTVYRYPAGCSSDCSFTYNDDQALYLTMVNGTPGLPGEHTLTISGEGNASTVADDYHIMVGDSFCSIVSLNASQTMTWEVMCTAKELPAGTHAVSVVVQPVGAALHSNPSVTSNYSVSISLTSLSPSSGGTGGGYPVVVSGSGLPSTASGWREHVITINGNQCTVTAASVVSVTCIAPPGVEGVAEVNVVVGGKNATLEEGFTYVLNASPSLTSVSPATSSVLGGEELTITGTGFGNGTDGWVKVGSGSCEVVSWTPTTVTCTSPVLPPGHHSVTLYAGKLGHASGTVRVNYTLKVTATSRLSGSVHGGTLVVLKGAGFGTNCSLLKVDLGENVECQVMECHDTALTCRTRLLPVTHVVTNSGSQSGGVGLSWEPQVVRAREGDKVTWVWKKVTPNSQLLYNVFQVTSPAHWEYDGSGFHSGSPTSSGTLTVTFLHAGTNYYAGSPVSEKLVLSGHVEVTKPDQLVYKVNLTLGGVEAEYDPSEESVGVSVAECEDLVESPVVGCESTTPTSPDDTQHLYFITDLCLTPTVTNITTNTDQSLQGVRGGVQVRGGSELTIGGSGFSTVLCQVQVQVGAATCTVTTSSLTSLTCNLDDLSHLVSLVPLPLQVTIINRGTANTEVSSNEHNIDVIVVPVVTSLQPTEGSLAGGTIVTIKGSGLQAFDNIASVKLGSNSCKVVSVSPTSITCSSPPAPAGSVLLYLTLSALKIPVELEQGMEFTFSDTVTSSVSNVSVSGETFNITGSLFGSDPSKVIVTFIKTSARRKRTAENYDGPSVFDEDDISNEETVSGRIKRHASDSFDAFDKFLDAGNMWSAVTNTPTMSIRERREVWRVAGSLPAADEAPVLKVSRVRRDTDQTEFPCEPSSVSDENIVCQSAGLPAGTYTISVSIDGLGNAAVNQDVEVTTSPVVTMVIPTEGSINGGTLLTLIGSGFTPGEVSVTTGGQVCQVESASVNGITCRTSAHDAGAVDVVLSSAGVTITSPSAFTYLTANSPVLTTITPSMDVEVGTVLTVSGTGLRLSGSDPEVLIGGTTCTVTAATDTTVTCSAPDLAGGSHAVVVRDSQYGDSNGDRSVTYSFSITSVSPTTGGFGGIDIVISGHGFDPEGGTTVGVCGSTCTSNPTSTSTSITCTVPPKIPDGVTVVACDVVVSNPDGSQQTASNGFTYDGNFTLTITGASPARGGTAGGTQLTITGDNFAPSGNEVTIDGSPCLVMTESVTTITCVTEAHAGPGSFPVTVTVPQAGYALNNDDIKFFYIDLWSSEFTWGGDTVPSEGHLVVVNENQTILLDQSTPVLKMLLIKGGKVTFDQEATEIILRAEYILIVEGGSLVVGTETEPYPGEAVIELHGNTRSIELPIYGAKVIAVRHGNLDLHGLHVPVTWTHLASTAPAGATTITLTQSVTWKPKDHIVIASTERMFMNNENEVGEIQSVSEDGLLVTLTKPLQYQHLSLQQTLGGRTVYTQAEVGLLTRNVKVRGAVNTNFNKQIPPSDDTCTPSQFNTPPCFNGKFGDELGGDEFGATIMFSGKRPSEDLVWGRLENVEITEGGQAYQLGRHPINFHLAGSVEGSYVRGCSLHHNYNRAITIHATQHLTVRHNVIYNTKGHAVFTEDGVEVGNVMEYNLVVFTRPSSSMLNTDFTPAAFWVTNPDNIIQSNAVAGGTHFGFWYHLDYRPTGYSSRAYNTFPNRQRMGQFANNTAHSLGRYGLWVFSRAGYYPTGISQVATWEHFTAWRCERGAEAVLGGALQFHNFVALDNDLNGLEMVNVKGNFGQDDGPGIFNSLVVGYSSLLTPEGCGSRVSGITAPGSDVFNIADTDFVNYDTASCTALAGCSKCGYHQGGYKTQVKNLTFHNSPNKLTFKWQHESVWIDTDGSLTGIPEARVLPATDLLPPTTCDLAVPAFSNPKVSGAVCSPPIKFLRFFMRRNTVKPSSLWSRNLLVSNSHGNITVPVTSLGWMAVISTLETYNLAFDYSEQITNITYRADTKYVTPDDYYYVEHQFIQTPDKFKTTNVEKESSVAIPDPATAIHGDYYWDEETRTMTYIVHGKLSRKKREVFDDREKGSDRNIYFQVYRCMYEGCITPTLPAPITEQEVSALWSHNETWKNESDGTYHIPVDGDNLTVPQGMRLVVDTETPSLSTVTVYGTLVFSDTMDHEFVANIIFIQGGEVKAGDNETDPFTHKLTITLRGSHDPDDPNNKDMPMPNGVPSVGWKAIGVFGQLSLFGQSEGRCWVKLGSTAAAGQSQITLTEPVDAPSWLNKTVMITTSGKEATETEIRTVVEVSGTTLTLDVPLTHQHLGSKHTLPDGSTEYLLASEVGLLTRNIVVQGNTYPGHEEESFGARILVSKLTSEGITYIGKAQLYNVELRRAGQEGFTNTDDPRYSLAFHGLGEDGSDSWVKRCSFNLNYNTAIGTFGTNNLMVEDNVVYHTVGSCIRDEGNNNTFRGNLVSVMLFTGTYRGRRENQNTFWFAGFSLTKASNTILENNIVAGSEQVGFQTYGESCDVESRWTNNEVHSAIYGVQMKRTGGTTSGGQCQRLANFYVWRAWFTAFYMEHYASLLLSNVLTVDCYRGVTQQVYGPPAISHTYQDKTATVQDSVFVGASPDHTCDYVRSKADIQDFYGGVLGSQDQGEGNVGVLLSVFLSRASINSYPALHGASYITRVKFAHYETRECGKDVAIMTNYNADDATHPVFVQVLTFLDTPHDNYLFLHRPKLHLVNPGDCVDMDCDGHKKVLIQDVDGSLSGNNDTSTITSVAEYEWDGASAHGVGDYRIPVSLQQNIDGSQIEANDKFPNKGIVRDGSCVEEAAWQAWRCTTLAHRMLVLESLDVDTEVRRLSPIALIANPGTDGYVDLVNGPKDHGWCLGYSCQERISTFYSIVATNHVYEVAMTGTPPQKLRLHLLHTAPGESVVLRLFYPKSQRYDVYVDDTFIPPTNIDNDEFPDAYQLVPDYLDDPEAFFPTLNDTVGTNYLQRRAKFLHVVVGGGQVVDIIMTPAIILTLGIVIDIDSIFEEDVVNNMALLLDVPVEHIRITDIIREDGGRRKRGTSKNVGFRFEVAGPPAPSGKNKTKNITGDVLDYDQLLEKTKNLVLEFQSSCSTCNLSITTMMVTLPVPPPEDPGPPATKEEGFVVIPGGEIFSNIQQQEEQQNLVKSLTGEIFEVPKSLRLVEEVPPSMPAFFVFPTQLSVSALTDGGAVVNTLGLSTDPWMITVRLTGGSPEAVLQGTTTVAYRNGSATFTDLSVNTTGVGYGLNFSISHPQSAPQLAVQSTSFNIDLKPAKLLVMMPVSVITSQLFSLNVSLVYEDAQNNTPVNPVHLQGQTMTGSITIEPEGVIQGNVSFELQGGEMSSFSLVDLRIDSPRAYTYTIQAVVMPADWRLTANGQLVVGSGQQEDEMAVEFMFLSIRQLMALVNRRRCRSTTSTIRQFAEAMQAAMREPVGTVIDRNNMRLTIKSKRRFVVAAVSGASTTVKELTRSLCQDRRLRRTIFRLVVDRRRLTCPSFLRLYRERPGYPSFRRSLMRPAYFYRSYYRRYMRRNYY